MNRPCDELLAGSGLAADQHRRVGRRNLFDLLEERADRRRRAHNLFEHRRATDLLAQHHVLVLDTVFSSLSVVDVRARGVPPYDLFLFISQWLVLDQAPAIDPRAMKSTHLQLERNAPLKSLEALFLEPVEILGIEDSRAEVVRGQILLAETAVLQDRPIRVQNLPGGAQSCDQLRNRVDDLPILRFTVPQSLFSTFPIF